MLRAANGQRVPRTRTGRAPHLLFAGELPRDVHELLEIDDAGLRRLTLGEQLRLARAIRQAARSIRIARATWYGAEGGA